MPRVRTIKPEFWQDEKLSGLEPLTRLVFLGLISQADDAGRIVDNPKLVDGLLFPQTDDTCRDSLDTLARLDRILRYTSESGQPLIQVVNWHKHQKIDHPSKYTLPGPSRETLSTLARDTREMLAPLPSSLASVEPVPAPSAGSRAGAPADQPATDVAAQTDETAVPTAVANVEAQASEIIRAANHGMVRNDSIDADRFRPIEGSHGSRSYVLEWLQAGIPYDLIESTVAARAAAYQPSDTRKQITTMKYFDPAVRDEWTRRQALPPPGSQAAAIQDEYPGNGRAGRRPGFVRVDDYDPEKEERERQQREAQAIAEWCRSNPAEAAEIRDRLAETIGGDSRINTLPEPTVQTIVESRIRGEIWQRIQST